MTTNKCPLCGAPTNWEQVLRHARGGGHQRDPAWGPWQERKYGAFGLGDVSALPAGAEYERRRPVRDPAIESDVITPVLQSVMSGAVGALVAGAGAVVVGVDVSPWAVAALGGAGVLALAWFTLLREHRGLLWEIERVTGADLDRDGAVGAPGASRSGEPREVRVEVTERGRNRARMRFVDVPLSDQELESVARAVLVQRESFSQRGLGDILSQEQYRDTYNAMLDGGLLRYKGKSARAGVELTGAGRAFLEQYLEVEYGKD